MAENMAKVLVVVEDQTSIAEWGDQTFGPGASLSLLAARANTEMAELLREVVHPVRTLVRIADEAADVAILLYRLASVAGFDLHAAVDRKMEVNRRRKWALAGDGTGRHVRIGG